MLSPYVVEVEAREPYKLWLRFDDGVSGIADLADTAAAGGIFEAWADRDCWRTAHVVRDSGAVAWGDDSNLDACPLSLYLDVTGSTFEEFQSEQASA
ncbi:DUF2442 domain-containing protein [Candidatus Poriferisodalis sp.]|uniref:DUF2442 domain-containing protein n=1 Tax=Candidatus Poriferisodalis sp. TaxID=3101277 RepID=UPI003B016101